MGYYNEHAPHGWATAPTAPHQHELLFDHFRLKVLQHPKEGKAATAKDKDRKPLDPPPIVQLTVDATPNSRYRGLLSKSQVTSGNRRRVADHLEAPDFPWTMCVARLEDAEQDNASGRTSQKSTSSASSTLIGNIASSVHKAKIGDDDDKREVGVLVFPNLSVRNKGRFRLHFTAYIMPPSPDGGKLEEEWVAVAETTSEVFNVLEGRAYPGLAESTSLTRTLADQGIKLRLHRESAARRTKNHNQAFAESQDGRGGSMGGKRQRLSADSSIATISSRRGRQRPLTDQYNREPSLGQTHTPSNHMGIGQPMLASQSTSSYSYAPTSMAQSQGMTFAPNFPYHTMAGQAGQSMVPSHSPSFGYFSWGAPTVGSPGVVASQMPPVSLPSIPQFGQNIPSDLPFDPRLNE